MNDSPKYIAEIIGPQIKNLLGINSFSQRLITDVLLQIKAEKTKYEFVGELEKLLCAPLFKEKKFANFSILFEKYGLNPITRDEWVMVQNIFIQKLIRQRNLSIAASVVLIMAGGGAIFLKTHSDNGRNDQPETKVEQKAKDK